MHYEWICKTDNKKNGKHSLSYEVSQHPLRSKKESAEPLNILTESLSKWSASFEEADPLLNFEKRNLEKDSESPEVEINYEIDWKKRCGCILNKYTTAEKLTILSSYLPGGEKVILKHVSNLNEKVKHRLEQLDEFEEESVRKTIGLTQQEYVTKINVLNDEIKKAWDTEQRVKAFKIVIQCSKLLADISVMQFYPSKFVLICDILDAFGELVYQRLKEKSFGSSDVKFEDIDPDSVPEAAKETCRNWLFKMASIRELLPRLYLEMALLKCYLFISKDEITSVITRLTLMVRGVGNPIVNIYLRSYLCHVASKLLHKKSEKFFYYNMREFIEEYQQIYHPMMMEECEGQSLSMDKYLHLYIPAIDWMLHGAVKYTNSGDTLLKEITDISKASENKDLLLYCTVSGFDSETVSNNSKVIMDMIYNSRENLVLLSEILEVLGEHLSVKNCNQNHAEHLIQTWWKIQININPIERYLKVLQPWSAFACKNLMSQHMNTILRGVISCVVKCGKPADEYSGNLLLVLKRIMNSVPDVEEVFLMDAFMPLLELAQTTNARTLIAKTSLTIFFTRYDSVCIQDQVIISSIMRLCCILHDSITAVTVEDEVKRCASLISKFVLLVTYDDVEQELNFYVECRAAFVQLDQVLRILVQCVNRLAMSARMRRSRWAQRACAAYCFVSVPSLRCALAKAQLYQLSAQTALHNNCLGQAEACLKALISIIPDIPEYILEDGQKHSTSNRLSAIINNMLSTLLILPDNMQSNTYAYILSGFIKTMERIHWRKTDPLYYMTLIHILDVLCAMTQENYAYHIDAVISNDKLHGSDTEFIQALQKHATNICQEILIVLKLLGDNKQTKKQYDLLLELFWRVVRWGDLESETMRKLAVNLWLLAHNSQSGKTGTLATSIMTSLRNDKSSGVQRLLQEISLKT